MSEDSRPASMKDYLSAFFALAKDEQIKVFAQIKSSLKGNDPEFNDFIEELRDKRFRKGVACPHCKSDKVVRNGKPKGRQKYKCSSCGKNFFDHTHTPLRGTHYPELWPQFMEHIIKGYSIRKSARILGRAGSTIFQWRHKLLKALGRMDLGSFEGLLEVDETFFLYSEKGSKNIVGREPRKRGGSSKFRGISRDQVCVVVSRDRNKETHAQVACLGPITKVTADIILTPYIGSVSTICSDANGTWKAVAKDAKKDQVVLNASQKERVKNIFHIQNVNAFHSRLKGWMGRFNGVATKFLDNYLTWFRFIDAHSKQALSAKKLELLLTACLPISPDRYLDIKNTEFILP